MEALFRAYFTECQDIRNWRTLLDVVADAGLNRSQAETLLERDDGLTAIKQAAEQARQFRVDCVPFFITNGKITLSGAQQPNAFLDAFSQAYLEIEALSRHFVTARLTCKTFSVLDVITAPALSIAASSSV